MTEEKQPDKKMCTACKTHPAVQKCGRCDSDICGGCWTQRDAKTGDVSFCFKCLDGAPGCPPKQKSEHSG
jgi:hypothetical protein